MPQDFAASWERSATSRERSGASRERGGYNEPAYMTEWQREDEKRRKKKEKEDVKSHERRRSNVTATAGYPNPPGGYPTSPYVGTAPSFTSRDRKPSYTDLSAQFGDLDVQGRPRKYSTSDAVTSPYGGPYSRPYAAAGPHISAYSNPSPNMRAADVLPPTGPTPGYPTSPYTSTGKHEPIARVPSPYGYTQPRSRATTPIPGAGPAFPQPRSRAASPVPGYGQPRSRAASPMPGGMPLPTEASFDRNQPTVPDCFTRGVNTALSFPAFDPIKIQEMDEFLERLPKLPLVLQSHDVNHHDWIRLTQVDMLLTCLLLGLIKCLFHRRERRTHPDAQASSPELLHSWNSAFFMPRGVEVVLYKGSARFSGPKAGITDLPIGKDDESTDSDSSSESSSEEETYRNSPPGGLYGGGYPAAPPSAYSSESNESRRRRREEKKRRRREKRMKRKQREREKKYSLYVTYVPPSAMSSVYSTPRHGVY
ncbi:hypothetical protein F5887DRAFT_1068925 [Amanita rubescens]|nr:hypothetical protein F5887DRAFT_1068925 [Amanita rubescens]